jgi:hypothetical protein
MGRFNYGFLEPFGDVQHEVDVLQPELALLLGHLAPAEQQLNHV